eukprot:2364488-Rhodomonas_salina.1
MRGRATGGGGQGSRSRLRSWDKGEGVLDQQMIEDGEGAGGARGEDCLSITCVEAEILTVVNLP